MRITKGSGAWGREESEHHELILAATKRTRQRWSVRCNCLSALLFAGRFSVTEMKETSFFSSQETLCVNSFNRESEKNREFPYTLSPFPANISPTGNILFWCGACWTTDEPAWIRYY